LIGPVDGNYWLQTLKVRPESQHEVGRCRGDQGLDRGISRRQNIESFKWKKSSTYLQLRVRNYDWDAVRAQLRYSRPRTMAFGEVFGLEESKLSMK
jgi:hypothetical protein